RRPTRRMPQRRPVRRPPRARRSATTPRSPAHHRGWHDVSSRTADRDRAGRRDPTPLVSPALAMTPPVVAIVGPTCTGKTSLAVRLAKRLGPAELLSADSRQLRRGLHVGTCAPTATELDGVRCHLLELADPGAPFSVADWVHAAGDALLDLERRDVVAIVVGGTGLYVTALVDGFDFGGAPPDPERRATRADLAATPQGLAQLAGELEERDPVGSAALDMRNPRRVLRALEILDARGGSLVDARRADPRPAVLVGLDVDDDTHRRWLQTRVFGMFDSGALIEEVDQALRRGVSVEALA